MILYHGSYIEIEEVDLSKCEAGKDFGRGFYVTKYRKQAEAWAERKGKKTHTKGVITEFNFDESFLNDNDRIKVLHFDDYTDEWLDFIVINRQNKAKTPKHNYDIVEGPVADDRIATQIEDYINGDISKQQFLNDLVRNPSHQICFCTMQSLQALSLSKGKIDSIIYHIDSNIIQALMIDYGLTELEATDKYYSSKTYSDLVDETTELYKKLWKEIYKMLNAELNK